MASDTRHVQLRKRLAGTPSSPVPHCLVPGLQFVLLDVCVWYAYLAWTNEEKIWKEGKDGASVYATLFLGKDAFGILDPEGEGMEMIVKTKGQIGGPLEQFSTIGYKFCHGAKILYQERMLRVESGSSFGDVDEAN